MSTLLERF